MSPEEIARYDTYWYNVGTQKAIDARDAALKEINTWSNSKRDDIVTVVGAVDLDTGNVAAGIKSARTHRGIYVNGKYICAEDLAVEQLGGNKPSIVMTPAIRPRTNNPKSVCVHCQKIYSKSQFMEGVEFE